MGREKIRSPSGNTQKGTAQADDQGWEEFRTAHHPGRHPAEGRCGLDRPPSGRRTGRVGADRVPHQRRYAEEGLDEALRHNNQVNRPRKVDERVEARPVSRTGQALITLACSPVPDGHDHWTMRALAGKVVELGLVESLSPETVRAEKNTLKPWLKKQWCIPKVGGEFVAAMEDVLDLYPEPYDPQRPVVCFDETSTQSLAEIREPLPAKPGRPRREDYEYQRAGTRNLFLTPL